MALAAGCGKSETEMVEAQPSGPPPLDLNLVSEPAIILVEAENAAEIVEPFILCEELADSTEESQISSQGKYVEIPEGAGKGKDAGGKVVLKFKIEEPGEYSLWARVNYLDACANSFGIQMDGYLFGEKDDQGNEQIAEKLVLNTFKHWKWVQMTGAGGKAVRFDLTRGEHTITFHNTEDGAKLDQFILTTEPDPDAWFPAGIMTQAEDPATQGNN